MVVGDLDFKGIRVAPDEADSPLVIDPNTVLSLPLSLQRFETVARRDAKVLQRNRSVQQQELSPGWAFDGTKASDIAIMEKVFRRLRTKRAGHDRIIAFSGNRSSSPSGEGQRRLAGVGIRGPWRAN